MTSLLFNRGWMQRNVCDIKFEYLALISLWSDLSGKLKSYRRLRGLSHSQNISFMRVSNLNIFLLMLLDLVVGVILTFFSSLSLFKGIINCRAQKIDIIINDQLRFFDACGFFFLIERKATSHLFFQWLQIRRSHGATDK